MNIGILRKKKRVDWEGIEQVALFRRLELVLPEVFDHAYHVPNGGNRTYATAAFLKAQGVKAGVSDICIDMARGQYHGLRIELKAPAPHTAATSSEQKLWIIKFNAQGYFACVCVGQDEAWKTIAWYMALGPFRVSNGR